ncbi:hypothetical protein QBC35DRAFT_393173 [Podospora australis]|uniref:Extracellular membrane protein CFEM domain-containing protein n=1 Tax=Podospora australis TaxID=1536484 RepID=A0AAN6WM04_9PEZI|nr:hypothetical protein QBC35DRAFT_393173 [Podospora australis]
MKLAATILGLARLVTLVAAQAPAACPTATKTIQNRGCRKECAFSDCAFFSTLRNPCNCPSAIPTATLIAPCEAECPYQGCDIEFRTTQLACPASTSSTRRWPPIRTTSSTRRTSSSSPTPSRTTFSTQTAVVTSVVTLPPPRSSTTTPCPTITRITSPDGCAAIRCPVPTCQVRATLGIPCNCTPRTVLWVQGCATACPDGCLTRTETVSAARC